MAFVQIENRGGGTAIGSIDTGVPAPITVSNNAATPVNPSGPGQLGSIVRAIDNAGVLGEGEFMLLKGVAATAIGSVVVWDNTFATTLCPATLMQARPVAIAMSANVNPAGLAWYQVGGVASVLVGATPTTAGSAIGISAAGVIGPTAVGLEIEGARCLTATNAGLLATVVLERPTMQGRIT